MSAPVPIRRALLSVSDKTDLVPFARGLVELGVDLVSTGGTAAVLRKAGLDVTSVEDITGFPEMMDGRVKTLHPVVHGALLARRDLEHHRASMTAHGIEPIDLVCINLYPFEQTIHLDGVTEEQAIEQIDIGGPAMLRSASKNHRFVTVVTAAAQYDRVINEMREHDGATTLELRYELAAAAFTRTAEYDAAISSWMSKRGGGSFPEMLRITLSKVRDLRYGENPHQKAAVYRDATSEEAGVVSARVLGGKPLSYNNLLDGAAALELVRDLDETFPDLVAAAVIKHASPCGAAVADDPREAASGAYSGDTIAAYGGILAISTPLDREAATRIAEEQRFLEMILAPRIDDDAVQVLAERWSQARLLATGPLATAPDSLLFRTIAGGLLVQEPDRKPTSPRAWTLAAGPEPDESMLDDAAFIWTVVRHLKSNAVAIGAGGRLLGGGGGQVDRVGACRVAVAKAAEKLATTGAPPVAASDAFFPFPDGPEVLIDGGVRCIVQPGGSKRDTETIDLCESRGVTLLLTGVRHFRH